MESALFYLQSDYGTTEISRFDIYDLGISTCYWIDVKLINPKQNFSINDVATLHFDEEYYHAVIDNVKEVNQDNRKVINLKLVPNFYSCLQNSQDRIYSHLSLKEALQTLLTEAGLQESYDFELRMEGSQDKLWLQQDNETGWLFFQKLVSTYGLIYLFEQTDNGVNCIITDNLKHLPRFRQSELSVLPHSGQNQSEGVNELFISGKLCSKTMRVSTYDPLGAKSIVSESTSVHNFAIGENSLDGYLPQNSEILQSKEDGEAFKLFISTEKKLMPGELVHLKPTLMEAKGLRVTKLNISAVQEQAQGSISINSQDSLHHTRINYNAWLNYDLIGLGQGNVGSSLQGTFRTARVENRPGAYADITDNGEYHIRMQMDEHPDKPALRECSKKRKASLSIRNALYYSGNRYGYSHPFQDGTEVIAAFENGHGQRPIIISAMNNKKAQSVVTNQNSEDTLLKSQSGAYLLFQDKGHERSVTLSQANKGNFLSLKSDDDSAEFILQSSTGMVDLKAKTILNAYSKNLYQQISKENQYHWINSNVSIQSDKGPILWEAKQNINIYNKVNSNYSANRLYWNASNQLKCCFDKRLDMKGENSITVVSENGQQYWYIKRGNIIFKAKEELKLKVGGSLLRFTKSDIEIKTPGTLRLNAPKIHGLG